MTDRISVIGLGKLGLSLAACLADRGFEVWGVDIDEQVVESLRGGKCPVVEPGLAEMVGRCAGRSLRVSTSYREAMDNSEVTFVIVPTPSKPDGSFSNEFIEAALRGLGRELKESKKKSHLFVISSTVTPGATNECFIPLIEEFSGRKLHEGFEVCYDPDFVALGNVVRDFLNPDLVVIGETSAEAGVRVEEIHRKMCENCPQISHMSIISAELAKVCLNTYVTLKISFANSVANLCAQIPGADVDAITQAIGADKRISPHYLKGGLSFGGTCFPRDTKAYITLADKYGTPADLVKATVKVNNYQDQQLSEIVLKEVDGKGVGRIGILGLAFTANTPVITESPSIKLIKKLMENAHKVVVFDPLAMENTRGVYGDTVEYADSVEDCLEKTNIWIVATRVKEYKDAVEMHAPDGATTVIDCWRMIDCTKLDTKIKYIPIGKFNGSNGKV